MEKALVLGASGGMGYSLVKELSSRGIKVVAFARTKSRLERLFAHDYNVEIVTGNLFQKSELARAAKGVDMIFHSANIPYREWDEKLLTLIANIVEVAKEQSIKLAVVDNIYAYGRSDGELVTETKLKKPHTKKGKLRLQAEETIKQSGVPYVIAHFPDFYGPNAESAILQYTLNTVVKDKKSGFVGNKGIAREFIFTPDGAKALVELALTDEAYGENWNIPGYGVITGEEIELILRKITGYQKKISTVTKGMIQFLGIFNKDMREVVEMFYLNEQPVVLTGEKYEKRIGPVPRTSYDAGLKQTIEFMKAK
ncbi:SDR family NAD(P)-dependent oxidoreductase [Niallia sp. Krafla_26]|uniref:SDR family NAD(P)-dependent oxidoreductase n=1 Tax=Niallia sp. Krafla_26 TaxID=3064703 RepID=UPI003D175D3E